VQLANGGLDRLGWETHLAYGQVDTGEAEAPLRAGLAATRIPELRRPVRPALDARALAALVRLIRAFRPHIIHTHTSKAGLVGRAAAIASSRAKRAHTFHGNVFDGYFSPMMSRGILAIERALGARTDAVVALSPAQREELLERRIAPPSRIHIVPLGVELGRFEGIDRAIARERLGIPHDQPVIVAVGRMVPIKRLDRMLRAISIVVAAKPEAHLYLIGGGPDRESLEALTRQLDLVRNVTFVGWSSETQDWYGAAHVVALSSAREGTPLALIEAAAAGRPVVATSVGGVPDVVQHGSTGIVVPDGDEVALAQGLVSLLSNVSEADRMGAAAKAGSQRFGSERLVTDLDALYRSLLHGRGS
jgi:glycosyltransferase involved in cell wall biosynthesis